MATNNKQQSAASGAYTAEMNSRHPDQTPNTTQEELDNYILTLHTDTEHQARLMALRNQYFPPHLNKLSAHIALFRALPGSQLSTIVPDILIATAHQRSFSIVTGKPFLMGHGVGIHAYAPPAEGIYKELKVSWERWLSKQDQSFKPHYTVQNKVEKNVAIETLTEVEKIGTMKGLVDGLTLWRYEKGYWKHEREFLFQG